MSRLLCKLGFHDWEFDDNFPYSFDIFRGCLRCGKIQCVFMGSWHDWAEGWTWAKWLEYKKQREDREDRMALKHFRGKQ